MGVIDILAEKGEGEVAVYKYVKAASRYSNSYNAIRKVPAMSALMSVTMN